MRHERDLTMTSTVDHSVQRLETAFDHLATKLTVPGEKIKALKVNLQKLKALPWGKMALGALVTWVLIKRLRS